MTKKRIDVGKLQSLGVPGDVIESIDPRDGGNITPEGEVLYLDEERRDAKVDSGRPLRKNHPDGLGLKNRLVKKTSKMVTTGDGGGEAFAKITQFMGEPESSAKNKMVNKFLGFDDKGYTHVHVMPLNIDCSDIRDKHHSVVVPYDLIIAELKDADFIAIMNFCICRKSMKCEHYPWDFGCIFMGPNGRHAVEGGIAHQATLEEAIAHVDKAAEMGLMAAADYVEGEQFIWGVQNNEMNRYRMICFCCDCCCLAMNVLKHSARDISGRYSPVGWTAVVDHTKCVGCKACESRCPQHCITFDEETGLRITDQDKCLGCGFCKLVCKHGAISIKQTMPMRDSLNDYYLNEGRLDDGLEHSKAVHVER